MSKYFFGNFLQKTALIVIFVLLKNVCFSQYILEIQNSEIEDISSITICLENEAFIQYILPKVEGKKLSFEIKDFKSIKVSHIGYYDTTILVNEKQTTYSILLRPKIVELDEVVIKRLKSYTYVEKKNRKGNNLLFNLEANKIWYFNISLTYFGVKRLDELSIELNNNDKHNQIEVQFFEDINAAVNNRPKFIYTIDLKKEKSNLVKIFNYKENNIFLMDDFILGLRLRLPEGNRQKNPIAVVTKFQENETQVYYQTEKGIIHKMPNEHYFKNFGGYPILVSTIKYEK